jgi:putative ABC transport system permease protein
MLRDLRLTVRHLRRERGYTVTAVLTLAVVVAANSAIFSAVYQILLKPLPLRHPEELVICWQSDRSRDLPVVEVSYQNFQDWATTARSFSQAAAVGSSTWSAVLERGDETARLASAGVSASFFHVLGVAPMLGRLFTPSDDIPTAPRVIILSYGAWVHRFGADARVIGTTVQLGSSHTIVGVMPPGFDFPRGTEFWTPVVPILAGSAKSWRSDTLRNAGVLFVIGRLRDGVTPGMAVAELDRLSDQFERAGTPQFGSAVVATPLLDHLVGPIREAIWALFAAVGVLLLIGCANVSGLMLTRVSLKRGEHAIRRALGASPAELGRQWVLETLVLSVAGGCLGLLGARWIVQLVIALAPDDVPRLSEIAINLPVAAFTLAVVAATALVCGTVAVRHAARSDPAEALGETARITPSRQAYRSRSLLLVFQIGLTVVLLIASGLVVRSFLNLRQLDLGFRPSDVLALHVDPRSMKTPANEWVRDLLARLAALPQVEAVGAVYLRPLALGPIGQETRVILEGQTDSPEVARDNPALNYQIATPGYFPAMRIQLKRGRFFTDSDTARTTRVALVGESTARRLWPGQDPIGKRMLMPTMARVGPPTAWRTVVGVVSDVRYRGIDDVRLDVYDAARQASLTADEIVVRSDADPGALATVVQAEARRLDPRVVVDRMTTMDAVIARASAPWRFSAWMFSLFGIVAFGLTTVGLFSLVSLDVVHRKHEFAVRLALGAQRRHILRSVFLVGVRRLVPGVAFGVMAAVAASRAIRSILFEVEPQDVTTYVAVTALVCGVVSVASYIPARHAARIDPLELLRRE